MFTRVEINAKYAKESVEYNINKDIKRYFPVKILPAITGLITIYLLTRTLSTILYSNYIFIMATMLLCGQLISGWINSSVIFFYFDYKNDNSLNLFKINVIVLQLLLFAVGSIGFAMASYFGLNDVLLVIIGLFLLLSQTFLNLLYSFLQAERRILVQIKAAAIQSIVQIVGFMCCFIYQNENLYIIMSILLLSFLIATFYVMYFDNIFALIFNRKNMELFDLGISAKILLYGLPVCVWFFASQFYVIGDRILLQYFNIKSLVVNYASFRDLSVGLSGFLSMPLLMASHPIIMEMTKNNASKEQIERILSENIKVLITLFTPVLIGILVIGDVALKFIVGDKYLLTNNLMFLIMLSILFGTIAMYLHKGLETTGKTMLMAKIALVVATLSFIFNFLLLPKYGVEVACVIALVSQIVYCVLVYQYSKGVFRIAIPYKFLFKNIFFLILAFFISNYAFDIKLFILLRFFVFLVLLSMLVICSRETRSIFKMFNSK